MSVDVIIGLQRGDEGKGRFVDLAAPEYEVVARGTGGANAGHTIVPDGLERMALHQVPSGIAYPEKINIIGNGVYLDPSRLVREIDELTEGGLTISPANLMVSNGAHLVFPHHIALDALRELSQDAQGSTKSGISYVAQDKYLREGVRTEYIEHDKGMLFPLAYEGLRMVYEANCRVRGSRQYLPGQNPEDARFQAAEWYKDAQRLQPYLENTVEVLNDFINDGKKVLAEGAQAFWLDINHGMYPMVTSSSTTVAGLLDGLGVAPRHLGKVTGVAKLVKSHVGEGPFVTEILDQERAEILRGPEGAVDSEYGASTGRPRRVGYPDRVELRSAIRANGIDELVYSKMDHAARYGHTIFVATSYELFGKKEVYAPSSAAKLAECEASGDDYDSWDNVEDIRNYDDLPAAAKKFIKETEEQLETPVTMLGVGPERSQVIVR